MYTAIIIISILAALFIVPRFIMSQRIRKMQGQEAPTPHKGSRKRIESGQKTLLYFYTPSCGACKMQAPIIDNLKKKYSDAVFSIDASKDRDAAAAYGVMGVPFLAFINQGKLVQAKAGVQTEAAISGYFSN